MSRASDWLNAMERVRREVGIAQAELEDLLNEPLRCEDAAGHMIAYLRETGGIWVQADGVPAAYQGKFVRWILDTFAEPEQLTIRAVESAGSV